MRYAGSAFHSSGRLVCCGSTTAPSTLTSRTSGRDSKTQISSGAHAAPSTGGAGASSKAGPSWRAVKCTTKRPGRTCTRKRAVRIEARGQLALERERHEVRRQRGAEALVAHRPADLEDDLRLEEERHVVRHLAVYLELEAPLAALGFARARAQPEAAAVVARGRGDVLAVEAQRDDADPLRAR